MARKTKSQGFFLINSKPYIKEEEFHSNALTVNQAEALLNDPTVHELKYMVPEGYICIDADEIDETKRKKYPKAQYPFEPMEFMEDLIATHRVKPYSYTTSNADRKHYWFKVNPKHKFVIDKHKLSSNSGITYPGVDTRGFRWEGKTSKQGAVYLKNKGKVKGGRPTPKQLVANIATTCYAPLAALLPNNLRPILKSKNDWEKTSLKLAKDMKFWGYPEDIFLEYCREQAYVYHDQHSEEKCKKQWAAAYEPKNIERAVAPQLYRHRENFYVLENNKFVLLCPWDLESAIRKTTRWVKDEKGNVVPGHWTRNSIGEKVYMLKVEARALTYDISKISFMNKTYDIDTGAITDDLTPHLNRIPHMLKDKSEISPETRALHKKYMTELFGNDKAKWMGIYLDLGLAMAPDLLAQTFRIWLGNAGNGKSGLVDFFGFIIGEDNTAEVGFKELNRDPHASAILVNKTVNLVGDINSNYTNEVDRMKMITAGDRLTANEKNKTPYGFKPRGHTVGAANKPPLFIDDDGSSAIARRLKFTTFPNKVKPSKRFKKLFMTEEHAELFIALAIDALTMYMNDELDEWQEPDVLEQWKLNTDPVRRFKKAYKIDKTWSPNPNSDLEKTYDEYMYYRAWCTHEGLPYGLARNRFEEKMKED